ncbi:unnamed protein product [Euphydryas editha]|uniref:Endonuclease/exonuclease/phosphatase domain-containing protein n=1 Tax=Euphydryas editha TaxID=104508 RepID=A0AAU9U2U4_EUPED|nr:unnamed protein product [Euphydryas editha]
MLSELDSDHRPVLIQLEPQLDLLHPTRGVLDWRKLDIELQSIDSPSLSEIPDTIDSVDVAKTAAGCLATFIQEKIDHCSREVPICQSER